MQGHSRNTEAQWPPLLTARRVVAYASRSLTSIDRAVASGRVPLAGRGERAFRREDADRWLTGASAATAPTTPRPLPARRTATTTDDALDRIARTSAGGSK